MRRLFCALALSLLASPQLAQAQEPAAAPGSVGQGMIEHARATGVFELVQDGSVTLRHVQSGLVCHFADAGAGGRVVIFPGLARGDDVACDTNHGGAYITIYATRFPFHSSLDEQIRGAAAAIHERFADAQPFSGAGAAGAETLMAHRSVEFIVTRDGERMYTAASVAQLGDWTIKLRYTAAAADDEAAARGERAAAVLF